jgi:regulatory protein
MKINAITDLGGARAKVVLEDGNAFILYNKEIKEWRLVSGGELTKEDFQEIKEKVLLKRAKKRGLHLLEKYNRSEGNLRDKLKEGGYPYDVIEEAIDYIRSFGYLDDVNLARNIVESRMYQKSFKEIVATLKLKGIDRDIINQVMDKYYDQEYEKEAIKFLMNKKRIVIESITYQEKNKFFNHLSRKGFSYDSIQGVLSRK